MTNTEISVGRRKASIARVRFVKGKGKIIVNNQDPLEYFKRESLVMELKEPLTLVEFDNKSDILYKISGDMYLDYGNDDYYKHEIKNCPDLAKSNYLTNFYNFFCW